jgi:ABC-type uncharacterized transport system substrate-binding protein
LAAWRHHGRSRREDSIRNGVSASLVRSASGYESQIAGLRSGLAGLGYVEGENITIEYRWADGHYDRLPALVSELVLPKVGVIVTQGTPGALAAKQGSGGIPVVMAVLGDPVATG